MVGLVIRCKSFTDTKIPLKTGNLSKLVGVHYLELFARNIRVFQVKKNLSKKLAIPLEEAQFT